MDHSLARLIKNTEAHIEEAHILLIRVILDKGSASLITLCGEPKWHLHAGAAGISKQ